MTCLKDGALGIILSQVTHTMFSPHKKTKHNVKLGIRCSSFVNVFKQCTVLTCKKNVFCV